MVDPTPAPAPAATPIAPSSAPAPAPAQPTPAPAPASAPAPTTLATLDPAAPPLSNAPLAPASFPDNWRDLIAGEDKGFAERLKRFASPNDLAKSYREIEGKMSSGELRAPPKPLPANATDEQKAQWRQANGLPDKPEGYVEKLALPNGVVIGEADKPLVGDFAKRAMEKGWSQTAFNEAVGWFYEAQAEVEGRRAENDVVARTQNQTSLMSEWGPGDYKVNMNAVGSLLAGMPEDFKVALLTARTADGQMLGDTVAFNKWAAAHARDFNPAATVVAPTELNAPKAIADEMAELEALMGRAQKDPEAKRQYYGDDGKPGLDARYRLLVETQQKMAARGRAA
ncbi:MAG TPA: hypothetical protein VNH21_03095 [Steroidobacteraceae bacterium]|nr:hypothetical protein [Steroidobacteraceae bacterium]